jgi:hypothetical protein
MKLPGFPTREDARTFQSVVERVAQRTGRSPYEIVVLLSYAAEAVVDEVARGHILRIPGLGVIAACKDERRCVVRKFGKPIMTPRFAPARGFRAQVSLCAPISSKGKNAVQRHQRNHSSHAGPDECSSRASTTAESIRASIRKQMGGIDPVSDLAP